MKKTLILSVALFAFAGLSACDGVSSFEAKKPDGTVTDRVYVLNSAGTPVSPSIAIPARVVNGQFVAFGEIQSTGSILQQVSPIAAAAAIRPSVNNIDNSNSNSANANSSSSSQSWAEARAHMSQTDITNYNNCQPYLYGGKSYMNGSCAD